MEPSDALTAIIEASIALAGFSGIVVAVGRRSEGEWRPQEDLRLVNLLVSSFTALLVALLGVLLLLTSLPPTTSWRLCSVAWLIAVAVHSGWIVSRSQRLGDEGLRHTHPGFYWFAVGLTLGVAALQAVNVVWLRAFWPVFAGIATNMVLAARQFLVLLRPATR